MLRHPSLHRRVRARLYDAFGEPTNTLGQKAHWAIRPAGSKSSITILLDDDMVRLTLWLVDPHDRIDGMRQVEIDDEDRLEEVIRHVQGRVQRASAPVCAH